MNQTPATIDPSVLPTGTPVIPFTARQTSEEEKNRLNRWIITHHNCEDHGLTLEQFNQIIDEHRELKTVTREYNDPRSIAARTRLSTILGQPVTGVLLREPTYPDSIHINYYENFTFSGEEQAWVEKNPRRILKGDNTRSSTGSLAPELFTLSNLQALLKVLAPDAEWVNVEGLNAKNNYASDDSAHAINGSDSNTHELVAYISNFGEAPVITIAAARYEEIHCIAYIKVWGHSHAYRVLNDFNAYNHAFLR